MPSDAPLISDQLGVMVVISKEYLLCKNNKELSLNQPQKITKPNAQH